MRQNCVAYCFGLLLDEKKCRLEQKNHLKFLFLEQPLAEEIVQGKIIGVPLYNLLKKKRDIKKHKNGICRKVFLDLVYIVIYIFVYITREKKVIDMMTAKVFKNGRSQAIRLPKECRFSSDEVVVNKIGDIVILLPKQNKWDSFMKAIDMFSDDFMAEGRTTDIVQERDEL